MSRRPSASAAPCYKRAIFATSGCAAGRPAAGRARGGARVEGRGPQPRARTGGGREARGRSPARQKSPIPNICLPLPFAASRISAGQDNADWNASILHTPKTASCASKMFGMNDFFHVRCSVGPGGQAGRKAEVHRSPQGQPPFPAPPRPPPFRRRLLARPHPHATPATRHPSVARPRPPRLGLQKKAAPPRGSRARTLRSVKVVEASST